MTFATPPVPAQARSATDGAGVDGSATAAGGVERLLAFDGLFLRADHLNLMQDYAAALARALGEAVGAGVVRGLEVSVDGSQLAVQHGLAVDGTGRPLLATDGVTIRLDELEVAQNRFWWILASAAGRASGDEPVTGEICDQPCAGTTSRPARRTEGLSVRLERDLRPGLDAKDPSLRQSWLAAQLFAAEEAGSGRWGLSGPLPDWGAAASRPTPSADVRLGVLLRLPDRQGEPQWAVDMWAARRDLGASAATRHWQWRAGMRPWDVFVAQVLQLQVLLAQRLAQPVQAGAAAGVSDVERLIAELATAGGLSPEEVERLRTTVEAGRATPSPPTPGAPPTPGTPAADAVVAAGTDLAALGIDDLPPAGLLPVALLEPGFAAIRVSAQGRLPARVCRCAPHDVAQAVAEAQHRPRIPLVIVDREVPIVDVLVPQDAGYASPAWVAFVRRDERDCGSAAAPEQEQVGVDVLDDSNASREEVVEHEELLAAGSTEGLTLDRRGALAYAAGSWLLSEDAQPLADEARELSAQAYALATGSRLPLVQLRALALLTDSPFSTSAPAVQTATATGEERIVLHVQPSR